MFKNILKISISFILYSLVLAPVNIWVCKVYYSELLFNTIKIISFLFTLYYFNILVSVIILKRYPNKKTEVILGSIIIKMAIAITYVITSIANSNFKEQLALIFMFNYLSYLSYFVFKTANHNSN